jgi:hypothetical protein
MAVAGFLLMTAKDHIDADLDDVCVGDIELRQKTSKWYF